MVSEQRIRPVLLCGGAGTRLWPLSRAATPKQMLALVGAESMLQDTLRRTSDRTLFAPPLVVANVRQAREIRRQMAEIGQTEGCIILEPVGRNTAAAIALAALASDPEELLLVMPSDHVIGDLAAFHAAIARAAPLAADGWLMTFGIRPGHAETGYGYILRGEELGRGAFRCARFVEKPDAETAASYLADGRYDWNGGIFLFTAGALLDAMAQHAGDILADVRTAWGERGEQEGLIAPLASSFERVRSQSIDNAVMEHGARVGVVPVEMQWSDVGSWDALHELGVKDASGNCLSGTVRAIDSAGNLLKSTGPLVLAVGVSNLIVVASADAVLVLPRGESQRTKEAVELLKGEGSSSFL